MTSHFLNGDRLDLRAHTLVPNEATTEFEDSKWQKLAGKWPEFEGYSRF